MAGTPTIPSKIAPKVDPTSAMRKQRVTKDRPQRTRRVVLSGYAAVVSGGLSESPSTPSGRTLILSRSTCHGAVHWVYGI
jgi:hypothetical protein